MTNKPKPKLPCDGCAHLIIAMEKSIVCARLDGGAGLVGKDEAAKCERRVAREARNG